MAYTHTQELDKLIERTHDLQVAAADDGFDDAATKLEEAIEALRGIDFADAADEDEEND